MGGVAQVEPGRLAQDLVGLLPAAEPKQVLGPVDAHRVPEGPRHPETRRLLGALAHHLEGRGHPALHAQDLGEDHVRRAVLGRPVLPGDAPRAADVVLARAGVAQEGERGAERQVGVGLLRRRARRRRELERLLGVLAGLLPAAAVVQRERRGAEDPRALAVMARRQHLQRLGVGGQRVLVAPEQVGAVALEHHRGPQRLPDRVELAERRPAQGRRRVTIAGQAGALGLVAQQVDTVEPARRAGLPTRREQLDRAMEVLAGIRDGVQALRVQAGVDARRERGGGLLGAAPVVGELRRVGALAPHERLRERPVQAAALARHEVAEDRLAHQGVAEVEAVMGVALEQVLVHRRAQRVRQRRLRLAEDLGEQRLVGRASPGRASSRVSSASWRARSAPSSPPSRAARTSSA